MKKSEMIVLFDTFNSRVISRHRTVEAALKARENLAKDIVKGHGRGAYLPTVLAKEEKDGELKLKNNRSYFGLTELTAEEIYS